jgi:hypothetical protein
MTLDRRTEALLALVEEDRRAKCGAVVEEANERARALLAQAHADARAQVRAAFAEERARAATAVAAARARLATRRRLYEQQRAAALLATGLARLPGVLRDAWRDEALRATWVDAVVASALAALPRTTWRIAHPPAWPAAEQHAVAARLAPALADAPSFAGDATIDAGVRIAAGGNAIDGTLAGIVADRATIGARLLGLLEVAGPAGGGIVSPAPNVAGVEPQT